MNTLKALVLGTYILLASASGFAEEKPVVTLFKSPTCGCCTAWGKHMEDNGFEVIARNVQNVTFYKDKAGVPAHTRSCHTAMIGDYAIEGHVPAEDIIRLLKEKPKGVEGLAVPGMPVGSPGMENGDRRDSYEVVSFTKDGKTRVYAEY